MKKINKRSMIISLLLISMLIAIYNTGCVKKSLSSITGNTVIDKQYLWYAYTLEQAIQKANHIVYGKVITKKDLVSHESARKGTYTQYNDVTIQVIKVIKSSETVFIDTETIMYYELPLPQGEERTDIPIILQEGQEVILFLNKYSRTLGPDFVIPVENGNAKMSPYFKSIAFKDIADYTVSVETLCEKITG